MSWCIVVFLSSFERFPIPEDVAGGGDGGCGLSPGLGPVEDDNVPRVARTALPQVAALRLDAESGVGEGGIRLI